MITDDELIMMMTLKVTRTGTDKINFKILNMLPTDINTIMETLNLTKVPVNIRVNKLEKAGLVDRCRGTGIIISTDFGKYFLNLINDYQNIVMLNITDILNKICDSNKC